MLFHTWPFLLFMAVVLPVFLALKKTRLWMPWLLIASYVFYGWWNPYYLILVAYSTTLDFFLVLFMDHCPREASGGDWRDRLFRGRFEDPALQRAFLISAAGSLTCLILAWRGPPTARSLMGAFFFILLLMAFGALFRSRRTWLTISLVNNLFLLLFFKYARFVAENINGLLHAMRLHWSLPDPSTLMPFGLDYVLPVGISFYTFQSLSYTIDFYRGKIERERSFIRFATFVAFFPQLVAGPIERASHLLPQFHRVPVVRWQDFADGASLFLVGLFKKLALANYLSFYVERVYERPGAFGAPALALATFAFAWQIFFDFSGYTDMARGVARLFGFELMLNFNNPYLATGLGDFWSRWHISLSTWFRDYVYIPLGGNRHGKGRTYRNLFLTFLISGIWHGAAWTFVIWGMLHGLGVIATRELERSGFYRDRVPKIFKQLATFAFVCLTWVFFRAESVSDAMLILRKIFTGAWQDPQIPLLMVVLACAVWIYQFAYESQLRPLLRVRPVRLAGMALIIFYLFLFSSPGGAFIYFQF